MRNGIRMALLAGGLAMASLTMACGDGAVRIGYRVYDPYYSDYHVWGPDDNVYYNRWIVETHRPYRGYGRLRREDQHAYWTWRHDHR